MADVQSIGSQQQGKLANGAQYERVRAYRVRSPRGNSMYAVYLLFSSFATTLQERSAKPALANDFAASHYHCRQSELN